MEGLGIDNVFITHGVEQWKCEACDILVSGPIVFNMPGLVAAVAATRAKQPFKLSGQEVKFLRTAIHLTKRDFATLVGVSKQSVLNWESGAHPISTAPEKLLRLKVCSELKEKAPFVLVHFNDSQIEKMKIKAARPAGAFALRFKVVRYDEGKVWMAEPREEEAA